MRHSVGNKSHETQTDPARRELANPTANGYRRAKWVCSTGSLVATAAGVVEVVADQVGAGAFTEVCALGLLYSAITMRSGERRQRVADQLAEANRATATTQIDPELLLPRSADTE